MTQAITGSIVALITPMCNGGAVDYKALKGLVEFHIENGTSAIVSVGTSGESATLSTKEHLEVLKQTIAFAKDNNGNNRIPIIAGTGANSTIEAIELTQAAKDLGADAALLVTPYYNKPTQEGLYQHYKLIANSVDIPQILYNVPVRTGVDLEVKTVVRLSLIANIIGIKDATGDLAVARGLIKNCPQDFLFYSGDDATAVDFIALGGNGSISVTANIAPKQVSKVCQTALLGHIDQAKTLDAKLVPLHTHLFIESNPIPVKWALSAMGKCQTDIRLPLTILSQQYQTIITQDLQEIL